MEHPDVAQIIMRLHKKVAQIEPYLDVPPPHVRVLSGDQATDTLGETVAEEYDSVTKTITARLDAICFSGLIHELYHHADITKERLDALAYEWSKKLPPPPPGLPIHPWVYFYEESTDSRANETRDLAIDIWEPFRKELELKGAQFLKE